MTTNTEDWPVLEDNTTVKTQVKEEDWPVLPEPTAPKVSPHARAPIVRVDTNAEKERERRIKDRQLKIKDKSNESSIIGDAARRTTAYIGAASDVVFGGAAALTGGIAGMGEAAVTGDINAIPKRVNQFGEAGKPTNIANKVSEALGATGPNNPFYNIQEHPSYKGSMRPFEAWSEASTGFGEGTAEKLEKFGLGRTGSAVIGAGVKTLSEIIPYVVAGGIGVKALKIDDTPTKKQQIREEYRRHLLNRGYDLDNATPMTDAQAKRTVQQLTGINMHTIPEDMLDVVNESRVRDALTEAERAQGTRQNRTITGPMDKLVLESDIGREAQATWIAESGLERTGRATITEFGLLTQGGTDVPRGRVTSLRFTGEDGDVTFKFKDKDPEPVVEKNENVYDNIRDDPEARNFKRLERIVRKQEKKSNPDNWSPELVAADKSGDWKTFSRLRGYTEKQIEQFQQMLDSWDRLVAKYGEDKVMGHLHGWNPEPKDIPSVTGRPIDTGSTLGEIQLLQVRQMLAEAETPGVFAFLLKAGLEDSPFKNEIIKQANAIFDNKENVLAVKELKGLDKGNKSRLSNTHESVKELGDRLFTPTRERYIGDGVLIADQRVDKLHISEDVGRIFTRGFAQADTMMGQLTGRVGDLYRNVAQNTFNYVALGKRWLKQMNETIQPFNNLDPKEKMAAFEFLRTLDEENISFDGLPQKERDFRKAQIEFIINQLPPGQRDAVRSIRTMLNDSFRAINMVREMRGLNPVKFQEYYFPRIWAGRFKVRVGITQDGHIRPWGMYAFDNKLAAENFIKDLEKNTNLKQQGFHISDHGAGKIVEPSHKYQAGDLLEIIDDNFARMYSDNGMLVEARKQVQELHDQAQRKGFAHEKKRHGIHGYIGDTRDIINPTQTLTKKEMKNMHEMMNKYLEVVANHVKDALIESNVKTPLSNLNIAGVFENTPRLHLVLNELISRNTEKPDIWPAARLANDLLDKTTSALSYGVGKASFGKIQLPSNFINYIQSINGLFYHTQMFLAPGYALGNLTQLSHSIGRLTNAHVELTNAGEMSGDLSKATSAMYNAFKVGGIEQLKNKDPYMAAAIKHLEGSGYIQVQNALHQDPLHMISTASAKKVNTTSPAEAAKFFWSELQNFYKEETQLATNKREKATGVAKVPFKAYESGVRTFYEWFEQRNRTAAAIGFLEYFRDVYPNDPLKAANAATRMMNQVMGSYERGRGSGFYTHGGHVGTALKPFTTLRNQYLGNFVDDMKTMVHSFSRFGFKDKRAFYAVAPVLVSQSVFLLQAGVGGMVAMKEAEELWDLMRENVPYMKDIMPPYREVLRQYLPEKAPWLMHGALAEALPGKPNIGPSLAAPGAVPTMVPPALSVPYHAGALAGQGVKNLGASLGIGSPAPAEDMYPHVRALAPRVPTAGPVKKIQELGQSMGTGSYNPLVKGMALALQSTSKLGAEQAFSGSSRISPQATVLNRGIMERTPSELQTYELYGTASVSESRYREGDRLIAQRDRELTVYRQKQMKIVMDAVLGISSEPPQKAVARYLSSGKAPDVEVVLREVENQLMMRGTEEMQRTIERLSTTDPARAKFLYETMKGTGQLRDYLDRKRQGGK
jgi:hypothetical protein